MQPNGPDAFPSELVEYIRGELAAQTCLYSNSASFVKGFIFGQFTVIIVIVLALRYLVMQDMKGVKKRYIPSGLSNAPPSRAAAAATQQPAAYITSKTYYDVIHYPPESTDWLNVLIAQAIMHYRQDATINNRLILAIDEVLNGGVRLSFIGPVNVTELRLGEEFPIFSRAQIRPLDDVGSMRAEIDFEYNDQITLGIRDPSGALLAATSICGTTCVTCPLTIELINPPATKTQPETPLERYVAISSYSDFVLDFQVRSLIGSRTKVEDLPKLTELIIVKLRNAYIDKLVYPMFVKVKVHNMWEGREKRAREHNLATEGSELDDEKLQSEISISQKKITELAKGIKDA